MKVMTYSLQEQLSLGFDCVYCHVNISSIVVEFSIQYHRYVVLIISYRFNRLSLIGYFLIFCNMKFLQIFMVEFSRH
jgi:hypothetical protein